MRLMALKMVKPISFGLVAQLKKKANENSAISSERLDTYSKGQVIDHYWTRIRELEFVQRTLLAEFL